LPIVNLKLKIEKRKFYVAGVMVRKYVGKVEDFLIARRQMDVYLGVASLAGKQ